MTNPSRIKDLELHKVKKVYASGDHSFALTENKEVFGWGSN